MRVQKEPQTWRLGQSCEIQQYGFHLLQTGRARRELNNTIKCDDVQDDRGYPYVRILILNLAITGTTSRSIL
jgi:hypothetical protein